MLALGVMFSIARSTAAFPTQVIFLSMSAVGLVFGTIYNSNTPDFYENNVHHNLGWVVSAIVVVQVGLGVLGRITARRGKARHALMPRLHSSHNSESVANPKYSDSHEHGNESETARSSSTLSSDRIEHYNNLSFDTSHDLDDFKDVGEKDGLLKSKAVDRVLARKLSWMPSIRITGLSKFLYNAIDRSILILGFAALTTGMVVYGGIFVRSHLTDPLNHVG